MKTKFISYFILLPSLLLLGQDLNKIQKNINSRNKDLNELKDEINKLENEINKKIEEEEINQGLLKQINNKIQLTEKLITKLNDEENYLSNLIFKNEQNIIIKEEELTKMKNQLKNRLIYLYKYGRGEPLAQLMITEEWSKVIYRTKYLQVLNKSEQIIKDRINKSIENLKLEKNALKKEKERKSFLISEKDREFSALEKDKKTKQNYINKIKKEKEQLRSNLEDKKKMMAQIEKLINKLYADKKELKKREEELIKLRSQQNKSTTGNFAKMKQKLPWPVDGTVIGEFGIQTNQKLKTQYENIGIDIKTAYAAPVKSILDGVVSSITVIKGYGNVVILDHGGGYYSVYSNIDNIRINEGDYIPSEIKIGNVAKNNSSNYNAEYLFHFQVWGNQKKLNPEDWLKKK